MIEEYKPLFIHLNPASIPEVVAHMQKYLTEHTFVTVEEFGSQFQEYIEAHPDIIKVGSVNGLTGDVVLTSENITMTGGSSDTIGAVIGDILDEASATGETVDDLVIDMDTAKTNITNLTSDVAALENVFVGATEESSGVKGLVPAPANTQTSHYLKATGDFEAIPAREVVSAAMTGSATVEDALRVLDAKITALNNFTTYTQPATINSHVNVREFKCVHYPNMKLVYLYLYFDITADVQRYDVVIELPASIPNAQIAGSIGAAVNIFNEPAGLYISGKKVKLITEPKLINYLYYTIVYLTE